MIVLRRRASLVELAEDWLTAKRAVESAAQAQKGNSDRARRGDLARWARLFLMASGRDPGDEVADAEVLWGQLRLSDLSSDKVVGAVAGSPWTALNPRCDVVHPDPVKEACLRSLGVNAITPRLVGRPASVPGGDQPRRASSRVAPGGRIRSDGESDGG